MKPVVFILQDFDEGGVQRVTLKILNQMAREGHDVTLIVLKGHGSLSNFLHHGVKKMFLHKGKVVFSLFALIRVFINLHSSNLVSAIVQVNIVSAIANAFTIFKHNHIIAEHTHSSLANENAVRNNLKVAYFLQSIAYPLASKVFCISKGIMDDLIKRVPAIESKSILVTNPVIDIDFFRKSDEKLPPEIISITENKKVLLGVGRLVPMKDFNLLIKSFSLARMQRNDLILLIVGDGPELKSLINLSEELGLSDFVHFIGHSYNPLPYFKLADVFVLTSQYEGFGLVLVEALALSDGVVSVNCECGPREILGDVGQLVNSRKPEEIANAILLSLQLPQDTEKMKLRAADFNVEEVVKLYYKGFA